MQILPWVFAFFLVCSAIFVYRIENSQTKYVQEVNDFP